MPLLLPLWSIRPEFLVQSFADLFHSLPLLVWTVQWIHQSWWTRHTLTPIGSTRSTQLQIINPRKKFTSIHLFYLHCIFCVFIYLELSENTECFVNLRFVFYFYLHFEAQVLQLSETEICCARVLSLHRLSPCLGLKTESISSQTWQLWIFICCAKSENIISSIVIPTITTLWIKWPWPSESHLLTIAISKISLSAYDKRYWGTP